MEMLLIWGK